MNGRGFVDLDEIPPERIRGFSIIAHVDHGKSTLADRLLELTGAIAKRDPAATGTDKKEQEQVLDNLAVEKNRGITVKAQTVSLLWKRRGEVYLLNLIDTPGHVDFHYEVARSLAASQNALLLVDATQGVQAQTVANYTLAFDMGLDILPVINKIDLPSAQPEAVADQIDAALVVPFASHEFPHVSAKTGEGVAALLDLIVDRMAPPPEASVAARDAPLRMLLFDSWYNAYKGVICLMAVKTGRVRVGDTVVAHATQHVYTVTEVGILAPAMTPAATLSAGQVGYLCLNMKKKSESVVGDTFYHRARPQPPVQTVTPVKPLVHAGVFPMDPVELPALTDAIESLTVHDPAISVAKETSGTLGQGFRLGFCGNLHMDVFRERLEMEHQMETLITHPTVAYRLLKNDGTVVVTNNPARWPDEAEIASHYAAFEEPFVVATLLSPVTYVGALLSLVGDNRGEHLDTTYLDDHRVMIKARLPLANVLTRFHSDVKARSSGYASFEYTEAGYRRSDLVKVRVLLNGEPVDALSSIHHRSEANAVARAWVQRLKGVIKRQLIDVAIQGQVAGKTVARETVKQVVKDVTQWIYGGDRTRKDKLLAKVKRGKSRMRLFANKIELDPETFRSLISQP
ncbi:hypothetical protein CXG81DRAFT_15546 [Caulochytrium protostelioides]|uniref:Tr-type G domain-containing protein n=1 Tax=Caulochytrium protostelioides TaxID=1555241 RepID=A0A4P9WZ00_9FUNG|nr:hypothetical protein CXG81DRAFT_15546 [Caulochytrium protostelioides]|eukprot:RKO98714.1 hypothetical protein CXG81DRAFT_15546 [Caulochytrium protostelioides]